MKDALVKFITYMKDYIVESTVGTERRMKVLHKSIEDNREAIIEGLNRIFNYNHKKGTDPIAIIFIPLSKGSDSTVERIKRISAVKGPIYQYNVKGEIIDCKFDPLIRDEDIDEREDIKYSKSLQIKRQLCRRLFSSNSPILILNNINGTDDKVTLSVDLSSVGIETVEDLLTLSDPLLYKGFRNRFKQILDLCDGLIKNLKNDRITQTPENLKIIRDTTDKIRNDAFEGQMIFGNYIERSLKNITRALLEVSKRVDQQH
jgi:hypothetical protein